ncbi:MAG: GAP family protein, partial [Lysinibacillus sp.]
LMLGLGYILETLSGFFRNQLMSWLAFLIGLALFIGSFYMPKRRKTTPPLPEAKGLLPIIGLGITTALLEIGMALPYFGAIGLMTAAELSLTQWLPILVCYNVLMLLPPVILYVLYLLFARWMRKPLEVLRRKMAASSDSTLSWVMCIVGILLILNTIDYL